MICGTLPSLSWNNINSRTVLVLLLCWARQWASERATISSIPGFWRSWEAIEGVEHDLNSSALDVLCGYTKLLLLVLAIWCGGYPENAHLAVKAPSCRSPPADPFGGSHGVVDVYVSTQFRWRFLEAGGYGLEVCASSSHSWYNNKTFYSWSPRLSCWVHRSFTVS